MLRIYAEHMGKLLFPRNPRQNLADREPSEENSAPRRKD